jgi:hypothetical protein
MRQLKDKQVSDHLFYLVLAYLDETNNEPIIRRNLGTVFDNDDFLHRLKFSLIDIEYSIFEELVDEAIVYFKQQTI